MLNESDSEMLLETKKARKYENVCKNMNLVHKAR